MTMEEFAADISDIGDTIPSPNILIHSVPGAGKTTLAAGLPNSLLLAFDPGWVSARTQSKGCAIRQVRDYRTLMAGLSWLEEGGHDSFQWIIADGLNMLQTRLLMEACKEAYVANPEKRVSDVQPDKPDYFKSQNALKNAVARLCDLPKPVLFTSHSLLSDDEGGDTWVRPHLEGRNYQVGNFVNGLMSSVGFLKVVGVGKGDARRQVRRILWQQRHDADSGVTYFAKDQLNVFGEVTEDLSAEALHKLVLGEPSVSGVAEGAGVATPTAQGTARRTRRNAKAQVGH
jgi:hypothetical protein